jgi:hypothetical protein
MLFNIDLVTDSSDEPYFLVWEGLSALFEHIGMANMESVKDSVSVDSENFLLGLSH